jgi:2,3-bisphosphoglycerate-independent phosphoglycerate mutase
LEEPITPIIHAMRRVVVIVPHWLANPDGESVLRGNLPALSFFAESGTLQKCSEMPPDAASDSWTTKGGRRTITPEAAWLGLRPESLTMQDGPLMVSALGADPPDTSVHFHLSLMSVDNGVASTPTVAVPAEHVKTVMEVARQLNTRKLTIVEGEGFDHALVWEEGSLEIGTVPRSGVEGKDIAGLLPEGDGEPMLRRFIDDSNNLLSSLELNHERQQEGLPPLNLLWPWGQGFRVPVPNLAIRRGEPCMVASNSLRLQGLARLAGYRHANRSAFGRGIKINLPEILKVVQSSFSSIVYLDTFTWLRSYQRLEEAEWFTNEIDKHLLQPLVDLSRREALTLTLVAPGGYTGEISPADASAEGLVVRYATDVLAKSTMPFDERALDERHLSRTTPWDAVDAGLTI